MLNVVKHLITAMHTRPAMMSLSNHSPIDPSPTQDDKRGADK
nr:hypothetical protein [Mucilaginibacter sp. L294]